MSDAREPRLDHAVVRASGFAARAGVEAPEERLLSLPERVVQFGTGALLRGLIDDAIDRANRRGAFGGRVVAVSSTARGTHRERELNAQDGLFTIIEMGMERGAAHREHRIVASVSRALSARAQWRDVLRCARAPDLALVVSNTTEVGIALDERDALADAPPASFPGKLCQFLLERARAFDYDRARGVVVLPCELIEHNGRRLRDCVLALGERWTLEPAFMRWLDDAVTFCDTLVDRIVPGEPLPEQRAAFERQLGYRDALLTVCEPYRLLAIQGDASVARALDGFAGDAGIVVDGDITAYRERKLRVLNGGHTAMVPVALLAGCATVREAMEHELVGRFIRRAIYDEIVPSLDVPLADAFARETVTRFLNPFIDHALRDIALHATLKWRVRVVPTIVRSAEGVGQVPAALALAFAAHLALLRGDGPDARRGGRPIAPDDEGERIRAGWAALGDAPSPEAITSLVATVCADRELWDADLSRLPGCVDIVADHTVRLVRGGRPALQESLRALTGAVIAP